MTRLADDLAKVVEVACETAWRSDDEQRALLRVAYKVDADRSKQTTTNKVWVAPYLEALVDETRRLDDGQRAVTKPSTAKAKKRAKA